MFQQSDDLFPEMDEQQPLSDSAASWGFEASNIAFRQNSEEQDNLSMEFSDDNPIDITKNPFENERWVENEHLLLHSVDDDLW
jgi:hypothetical protein